MAAPCRIRVGAPHHRCWTKTEIPKPDHSPARMAQVDPAMKPALRSALSSAVPKSRSSVSMRTKVARRSSSCMGVLDYHKSLLEISMVSIRRSTRRLYARKPTETSGIVGSPVASCC